MRNHVLSLTLAGLLGITRPAAAEVTRFEAAGPPQPAFAAQEFGAAGRYERLVARATLALDPADPHNALIADLTLAPRNAEGRVEAVAEVVILRPTEPFRGDGTMLVEVPNRGRDLTGQLYNDGTANGLLQGRDPGDGFLLRQGYTLVWIGWQADIPSGEGRGAGLRLEAPIVPNVTGLSGEEFLFDNATNPVAVPLTYPATNEQGATLTVRGRAGNQRQTPCYAALNCETSAVGVGCCI